MQGFARGILYLSVALTGCDSKPAEETTTTSEPRALMQRGASDKSLTIAVSSAANFERLPELFRGEEPRDFHWVSVTVAESHVAEVLSSNGIVANLADPANKVTFRQVYDSICNPATEDTRSCFVYEKYTAGDPGLTGTIELRLIGNEASGTFDVTWEGNTDRFGEPVQRLRHVTVSGYRGPVTEVIQ